MPDSLRKMRREKKDSEDLLQAFPKHAMINGSVKNKNFSMLWRSVAGHALANLA